MNKKLQINYIKYIQRLKLSLFSWGFVLMLLLSAVLSYVIWILGLFYVLYVVYNLNLLSRLARVYITEISLLSEKVQIVYYNKDDGPNHKVCDISMLKLELFEPTRGTLIPSSLLIQCGDFKLRQYSIGEYDRKRLQGIYIWLKNLGEK